MINKITALFVLLTALVTVPVQAQTIGLESKTTPTGTSRLGNIYVEEVSEKTHAGLFAWGLADTGGFGEIYIGPTWYPRKWVELQVGAGIENHPGFWRVGTGVFLNGHLGSATILWETGVTGYWYKVAYSHHVAGKVSLGVFSRRFAGTGPIIEVKASKSYTIWVTAGPDLQDHNRMKAVVGMNITPK